jgi:hypothetical protein
LTETSRSKHVHVANLLRDARILSYNEMVVKAMAAEVWNSKHSTDGPNGSHNPTGNILFPAVSESESVPSTRPSRAQAAGHIRVLARRHNTFVRHGVEMYNGSFQLRAAMRKGEAKRVAKNIAKSCPI